MSKTLVQIQRGGEEPVTVPMPTWTDPTSIVTWATAIIASVNGLLLLTHTGYVVPTLVTALVSPLSFAVSGLVVAVNILRHSRATVAALTRG